MLRLGTGQWKEEIRISHTAPHGYRKTLHHRDGFGGAASQEVGLQFRKPWQEILRGDVLLNSQL